MEKIVSISGPQISADDKSITVTVGHINMKEDGTDTQIVPVKIADGSERVATSEAAVSGAAVNDWEMEAAVSDGNRANYFSLGGSPWVGDNWKLYREESPIYAYPVHGHFPGDPVHRGDVMTRWIGWLNKYLK